MGIILIALDNIKKKKVDAIVLLLLVAMSVLLLYVGSSTLLNVGDIIDSRNDMINGADYMLMTPSNETDQIESTLLKQDEIEKLETETAVYASGLKYYNDETDKKDAEQLEFIFLDKDVNRSMSCAEELDTKGEWKENSILLPYYMKVGMGYEAGDNIHFLYKNKTYDFVVYGFTEDPLFTTPTNISVEKCFISSSMFEKLGTEWNSSPTVYRATLTAGTDAEKFEENMGQTLNDNVDGFQYLTNLSVNYKSMRYGTSMTINIFMAVLAAFAVMLTLISMIIVRFNVSNSMDSNIKNIGILEASGYTAGQLRRANLFEFGLIAFAGIILGLGTAQCAGNGIGGIVSASIGLCSQLKFDLPCAVVCGLVIMLFVLCAVGASSLKYGKIAPLEALRGGLASHNFKKDPIQLGKTKMSLNVAIGMKRIASNGKKNIIVCLIIIALTFCANSAACIYQNLFLKQDILMNLIGMEVPDVYVLQLSGADPSNTGSLDDLKKKLSDDKIEKIIEYTNYDMACSNGDEEKVNANCDVIDDPSKLEVDNMIEGRHPEYDNEIELSTLVAKKLNVTVGDIVYLTLKDKKQDYLVVGINQGINHLGKKMLMTTEGMARLDENMKPNGLYLYMKNDKNLAKQVADIKDTLSEDNVDVLNYQSYVKSSMSSITVVMGLLCIVMVSLVTAVVALILVLLIKAQIVRDKKQFGIYKALGYTTPQLIVQTTMNYLPVILFGTVLGSVFSYFTVNPAFALCLASFGIKKCDMEFNLLFMITIIVAICLWAEIVSVLSSLKIRKIMPYELIQEL